MPAPEITQFFSKYLAIFSDRPKQRNKDVAMLLEMHGDAQPRHDAVHGLSKHVRPQADRSLFVQIDDHNDIRHRNMREPNPEESSGGKAGVSTCSYRWWT